MGMSWKVFDSLVCSDLFYHSMLFVRQCLLFIENEDEDVKLLSHRVKFSIIVSHSV